MTVPYSRTYSYFNLHSIERCMRTNKNENNIRFLFLCRCFIREREKHRQFLIFFNKNIKAILFSVKISKIDAYPCVVLPDQHMRDLTDVYRREKDFLEQRKNLISSDEMMVKTKEEEETALKFYVKEQYCNISCNCETSSAGRISRIKMSVEFFYLWVMPSDAGMNCSNVIIRLFLVQYIVSKRKT